MLWLEKDYDTSAGSLQQSLTIAHNWSSSICHLCSILAVIPLLCFFFKTRSHTTFEQRKTRCFNWGNMTCEYYALHIINLPSPRHLKFLLCINDLCFFSNFYTVNNTVLPQLLFYFFKNLRTLTSIFKMALSDF